MARGKRFSGQPAGAWAKILRTHILVLLVLVLVVLRTDTDKYYVVDVVHANIVPR